MIKIYFLLKNQCAEEVPLKMIALVVCKNDLLKITSGIYKGNKQFRILFY